MKVVKEVFGMVALLVASAAFAADSPPKWVTEGPYVDDDVVAIDVPMDVLANKLFIDVEVGGKSHRFLFDTGSPSMMSAALAKELGLEIIDRRQGRDSHGALIETRIAQADLTLGDTTLHKVPVFIADFPKTAQCLFDGVLGSEVLPLCAWQIDQPGSVLRCHSELASLDHVETAKKQALHDFGYPHAPILDVRLADNATSKAMFDTGSPTYMAISPPDFEGARRNDGIGRTVEGQGSLGGSIGGAAPSRQQLQAQLTSLSVGNLPLGEVMAILREASPSLIGAAMLEHFIITLDASHATAYFDQYRDGPYARPSFGFGLDVENEPTVSIVWKESPADAAGMQPGQAVTSINGKPVDTSCAGIRDALRTVSEDETIAIEWDGGAATLKRE